MIPLPFAAGKTYAVFGLARTGRSVCAALTASGARVLAWDDGDAARAQPLGAAALVDLYQSDLEGCAALVVAPGVPLTHPAPHPLVLRARAAGIPVIGDIELFAQARQSLPAHRVVGITGTNGKSTTTALIHHALAACGIPARLGGNIGLPVLGEDPLPAGGVYVLELSSFQIDLTRGLACEVAVMTNLTPDHLDRHGDMAGYAAAKRRLFEMQTPDGAAVLAQDDHWTAGMAEAVPGRVVKASAQQQLPTGVSIIAGEVRVDGVPVASQADWPRLGGPHNAQNAACALGACLALGAPLDGLLAAFKRYPGLPHRMEWIAEIGGVAYVNDSKATNPTSTAPALAAFPGRPIHWILGGRRKTDELDACLPYLAHVKAAYTIGEAAALYARLLGAQIPVAQAGTLDVAIEAASRAAGPGDVVLLSPACASQDQFRDYEARGEAFRKAVTAMETAP